MAIIDAQVHLNHLGIEACLAAMDAVGIDGAVIDEFPPSGIRLGNGAMRHDYLMSEEAVRRYPSRFAYVARIDPSDPQMEELIGETRSHPGRLGLRVDQPPAALFENGGYRAFFKAVAEHRIPTWVVLPGRMRELAPYVEEFPQIPFIVDHSGMLERGDNSEDDPFRSLDGLIAMARYPSVAVKWGHMYEWSSLPYPHEDVLVQLRRVVDAFGADRVMWESDWTQCLGYQNLAEMLFSIRFSNLFDASEKEALLGGTALAVMRWDRPEDRIETILVGSGQWTEFSALLKRAGQLSHGGVRIIRTEGPAGLVSGKTVSTMPAPGARAITVEQAVEGALYGRIARPGPVWN